MAVTLTRMTNERVVYIAWSTSSGQFTGAVLLEFESVPSPKEEEEIQFSVHVLQSSS